jgi:VIT1/CCC1 family predicted Fe2+/Mn2+ transporter
MASPHGAAADHDHEHEHHRSVQSGSFRAAVFGMSDGLVSNAALILGVAGADASAAVVRTAGVAGLVAGACSMAAGEWLSMRAQRELLQRELAIERRAIREHPRAEQHELQALYEGRGIPPAAARDAAEAVMADEDLALEVHAREEIGIDPSELGNPLAAAVWSFVAFALGAFLPLIPWLLSSGTAATVASLIVAAGAATALGLLVAYLSHNRYLQSALRHLLVASAATLATFAIGSLFDVAAA